MEIPWSVLIELFGDGEVHPVIVRNGVVLYAPGELNLGRSTRLANRALSSFDDPTARYTTPGRPTVVRPAAGPDRCYSSCVGRSGSPHNSPSTACGPTAPIASK